MLYISYVQLIVHMPLEVRRGLSGGTQGYWIIINFITLFKKKLDCIIKIFKYF